MIPETIDRYLQLHELAYEHTTHRRAVPAQRLAAAEHVTGHRVAKPVVASLDGRLVMAVIRGSDRLDLEALRLGSGAARVRLADEDTFSRMCQPCETGAEPALELFGMPIYVDEALAAAPWVVMRAGTHEDAIRIDTQGWLESEHVTVIPGLGRPRRA